MKIPKMKIPKRLTNIAEKVLNFNNQQKGRERSSMLTLRPSDLARVARIACVAKVSDNSNPKILSPKQMLQKLTIAFAQVKAGNTSENLLNEVRQIVYSLYRAKEITKRIVKHVILTDCYSIFQIR